MLFWTNPENNTQQNKTYMATYPYLTNYPIKTSQTRGEVKTKT